MHIDFQVDDEYYLCLKNVSSSMMHVFFLLQLCHINKQWAHDCDSLAQRMSALEERIEQLNDHMGRLEEELSRQSTSTDEGNDPDSLTPPHPQIVENCSAPSVFLHGELVYEYPHVSACPLHQGVSAHTGTVLSVEQ